MDLSVNMGIACQWDDPKLHAAFSRVAVACRNAGKAAGILLFTQDAALFVKEGFSFLALSSDGAMVATGMRETANLLQRFQRSQASS
jgi:2-keto-3-deoxy-L-rhamnonate aldolase RhmA